MIELKKCKKCKIYTRKGALLGTAKVVSSKEKIVLYFSELAEVKNTKDLLIQFFDAVQGVISVYADITMTKNPKFPMYSSDRWMADCHITSVLDQKQRQKDTRVEYNKSIFFSYGEGVGEGRIQNVSAGGVYFVSSTVLKRGTELSYQDNMGGVERKYCLKVIRIQIDPSGLYGYGCQFIRLTGGDETRIRSFVYQRQIEIVRKQRQMNGLS